MVNYDKYLKRKNAPIPKEHLAVLENGKDIPETEVLSFDKKDQLLQSGYLSTENGFYHYSDGSAYAAVLTPMPSVTVEMIDWWFWWHAKEAIRYQIWYPDMHFSISSDFGGHYNDDSKSYRQRLQLSEHYVEEDIGTGREKIIIKFMSPEAFGFDHPSLQNDSETTIICAQVGDLTKRVWHTRMCHAVRTTENGVEMRSRFWMAQNVHLMDRFGQKILNNILNTAFVKRNLLPKNMGKFMFHHCTQEYNNLAGILPDIFRVENR